MASWCDSDLRLFRERGPQKDLKTVCYLIKVANVFLLPLWYGPPEAELNMSAVVCRAGFSYRCVRELCEFVHVGFHC